MGSCNKNTKDKVKKIQILNSKFQKKSAKLQNI